MSIEPVQMWSFIDKYIALVSSKSKKITKKIDGNGKNKKIKNEIKSQSPNSNNKNNSNKKSSTSKKSQGTHKNQTLNTQKKDESSNSNQTDNSEKSPNRVCLTITKPITKQTTGTITPPASTTPINGRHTDVDMAEEDQKEVAEIGTEVNA